MQELARLLPSLEDAKEGQLSKHVIVEESVKHHRSQHAMIEQLSANLAKLAAERAHLIADLNAFRASSDPNLPQPVSQPLQDQSSLANSNQFPLPQSVETGLDQTHTISTWEVPLVSQDGNALEYNLATMSAADSQQQQHPDVQLAYTVNSNDPSLPMDLTASSYYNGDSELVQWNSYHGGHAPAASEVGHSVPPVPRYSMWSYPII